MKISVVIPVFNAMSFVAEAVGSALAQPETLEVILVEDGSRDSSLAFCRHLEIEHPKVRLFTHPSGKNRGAAASRNLGVRNASGEYVAFLDADDFYLPDRFKVPKEAFAEHADLEGVLEATGTCFESPEAERRWREIGAPLITTVKQGTSTQSLFETMSPLGLSGHCCLDALTIKRNVFNKTGMFEESVQIGEDTIFFMRLAACSKLYLGRGDRPVSMRRVHASNTITRERGRDRMWQDRLWVWLHVFSWLKKRGCEGEKERLVLGKMLWDARSIMQPGFKSTQRISIFIKRVSIAACQEPALLKERAFLVGVLKNLCVLAS